MKKYSDYKNSSVPWIGEIPTTWNLSQLRYVIECLDGKRVPVELSLRADIFTVSLASPPNGKVDGVLLRTVLHGRSSERFLRSN